MQAGRVLGASAAGCVLIPFQRAHKRIAVVGRAASCSVSGDRHTRSCVSTRRVLVVRRTVCPRRQPSDSGAIVGHCGLIQLRLCARQTKEKPTAPHVRNDICRTPREPSMLTKVLRVFLSERMLFFFFTCTVCRQNVCYPPH